MNETTDRTEIAARAYEAVYADPEWGLKSSSEDALLGVINALYPSFPKRGDGFNAIRAERELGDLATYLWEELECEGLDSNQIAERLVPRLDATMIVVSGRRPDWDDTILAEAESAILDRLDVSLDETEQGLTATAVGQIETFVSETLGRPWVYEDSGMLGYREA